MFTGKLLPLATLVIACSSMARAEDDTTTKMMKLIFEKTYTMIGAGNSAAGIPLPFMVSLLAPGIQVHPMTANEADLSYVWDLADNGIAYSPVYTPTNYRISTIYKQILDNKKMLPVKGLTSDQKKALDAALDYTDPDNPNGTMNSYYDCQDAYTAASDAREAERWQNFASTGVLKNSATADNKVNRALDTWNGRKGNRAKVEAALATVSELTNYDPGTWWNGISKQFLGGKMGDSYMAQFFPRPEHWADADGWVTFSFNSSESTSSSSLDKKAVEASVSIDKGAFSGSASGGWSRDMSEKLAKSASTVIQFSAKRVLLMRKWLEWLVFSNTLWAWNPTVQGSQMLISDGKGHGLLPVLPVSFIMVKDVTITVQTDSSFAKDFNEHIHAEAKASFCGINLSGSYASTVANSSAGANSQATTITIPTPQILAVISNVVPPTPASLYAGK